MAKDDCELSTLSEPENVLLTQARRLSQVFETATACHLSSPRQKTGSAGMVSDEPIELVDLYRTLAELAGLPQPPTPTPMDHTAVQGKSLVPVLEFLGGGPRACDCIDVGIPLLGATNRHCRVRSIVMLHTTQRSTARCSQAMRSARSHAASVGTRSPVLKSSTRASRTPTR